MARRGRRNKSKVKKENVDSEWRAKHLTRKEIVKRTKGTRILPTRVSPDHGAVGEGQWVTCDSSFHVGRGVVGDTWVVSRKDVGFSECGVLTVKRNVSIL
jgi:hypothetical protein